MSSSERIAAAFAGSGKRAALMPYLMAGYPTVDATSAITRAYIDGGADLIEFGIPFSDPLADGPVIHAAAMEALRGGAKVSELIELAGEFAAEIPVVVMCYANPVFARGAEGFVDDLARLGISGLIVPDLPLEEAEQLLGICDAAGVALVPLVAPTTPDERLTRIGERARGFLYTVSVTGTTGERQTLADDFSEVIARAKSHTAVPVALGFGIGTPDQAAAAAQAGADGVIIGSRLVRAAGEDSPATIEQLVSEFAAALR